jgi:hypothetical protein
MIFDAEPSGIANPWASMPEVKYIMLEYKGLACHTNSEFSDDLTHGGGSYRTTARSCISFLDKVNALCKNGVVLYDDGKLFVVKLSSLSG